MEHVYDMIVLGGGPGGYTAALYGTRAGLDTLILEKMTPGGQMALTHQIDNYPGFSEGIDGFTLGMQMQQQAERFGARTVMTEVLAVELEKPVKRIVTDSGEYLARAVVLSTGANPRPLGVPGEEKYLGRGIHYCAACDGMFYRGKTVVVVGGGNTAAADALLLSRVAKEVHLVHRRDSLRATKIYHDPLLQAENVHIHWNSAVSALTETDGQLSGVVLRNVQTGEESPLSCHGGFVSIGRDPASALFRGQVTLDEAGYVVADESTKTNLPGVFAVGDLRTKALRQVITAASDGAMAAYAAEEYLAEVGR